MSPHLHRPKHPNCPAKSNSSSNAYSFSPLPATPRSLLAGAILALLVVLAYLPLWHAGFVWDDFPALHQNAFLRQSGGLWKIWTTCGRIPNESHYWPMVYTTYWLEHQLWGMAPLGYHLTNLALHLANTFLLWRLLGRAKARGAWLAALLFGLHPVHVESVAWLIERKDVLSGFFYLFSFYCFVRADEGPGRPRWQALAILGFILAMLSKSIAITLPLALLVWLWWREGRLTRRHFRRVAPLLTIALLLGAADTFLARRNEHYAYGFGPLERLLLAGKAFWFYVRQLAWPDLMVVYPKWAIHPADWTLYLYGLGAAALLAAVWFLRGRLGRAPLAATLYFGLTLGPTLGLVGFIYMQHSYVADRFQYLASIGPLTLAAAGAAGLRQKLVPGKFSLRRGVDRAGATVLAVVLLALGALTWHQADAYRDLETLFQRAVAKNPGSALIYNNLGTAALEKRQWAEAEQDLRRAIALNPAYELAHSNLAVALGAQGRVLEAAQALRQGLACGDPRPGTMNDLAWYLATSPDPQVRRPAEAVRWAEQAAAHTGGRDPAILDTQAAAYAAAGRFAEAVRTAEKAQGLARLAGKNELACGLEERLAEYRQGRPYIEKVDAARRGQFSPVGPAQLR